MIFSTKVPVKKSNFKIDHHSKIILLGSCFSENIGSKLDDFKFQNFANPFGIIFNPISIENLIRRAVLGIDFTENDVFFHEDLWKCFEVHSQLNGQNKEGLLNHLNLVLNDFRSQLLSASHLVITFLPKLGKCLIDNEFVFDSISHISYYKNIFDTSRI